MSEDPVYLEWLAQFNSFRDEIHHSLAPKPWTYVLGKSIAKGKTGEVFNAEINSKNVAVKRSRVEYVRNELIVESRILRLPPSSAISKHVMRLLNVYMGDEVGVIYLSMPLMEGNINDLIASGTTYDARSLVIQLFEGLAFVHNTLAIALIDIHTGNTLYSDGGAQLKLADFGYATPWTLATSKFDVYRGGEVAMAILKSPQVPREGVFRRYQEFDTHQDTHPLPPFVGPYAPLFEATYTWEMERPTASGVLAIARALPPDHPPHPLHHLREAMAD